jgi:hypothetical protein
MLFSPDDITQNTSYDDKLVRKREKRPYQLLNFESYAQFSRMFEALDQNTDYHIINYGTWSMHEFLIFLLKNYTGPAELWITTWSINENVVQTLVGCKNEGLIKNIHFLFDYRVKKYRPAAWFLASQQFNCVLTSCHAKVTVIVGEKMSITIVGSANYNRNNRIEVMILMPGTDEANQHKNWISSRISEVQQ